MSGLACFCGWLAKDWSGRHISMWHSRLIPPVNRDISGLTIIKGKTIWMPPWTWNADTGGKQTYSGIETTINMMHKSFKCIDVHHLQEQNAVDYHIPPMDWLVSRLPGSQITPHFVITRHASSMTECWRVLLIGERVTILCTWSGIWMSSRRFDPAYWDLWDCVMRIISFLDKT